MKKLLVYWNLCRNGTHIFTYRENETLRKKYLNQFN